MTCTKEEEERAAAIEGQIKATHKEEKRLGQGGLNCCGGAPRNGFRF